MESDDSVTEILEVPGNFQKPYEIFISEQTDWSYENGVKEETDPLCIKEEQDYEVVDGGEVESTPWQPEETTPAIKEDPTEPPNANLLPSHLTVEQEKDSSDLPPSDLFSVTDVPYMKEDCKSSEGKTDPAIKVDTYEPASANLLLSGVTVKHEKDSSDLPPSDLFSVTDVPYVKEECPSEIDGGRPTSLCPPRQYWPVSEKLSGKADAPVDDASLRPQPVGHYRAPERTRLRPDCTVNVADPQGTFVRPQEPGTTSVTTDRCRELPADYLPHRRGDEVWVPDTGNVALQQLPETASAADVIDDDLLVSLSTSQLREKLEGYPEEEVLRLIQKRRALLNRFYTQNSRTRRIQIHHELEVTNRVLLAELRRLKYQLARVANPYLDLRLDCTADNAIAPRDVRDLCAASCVSGATTIADEFREVWCERVPQSKCAVSSASSGEAVLSDETILLLSAREFRQKLLCYSNEERIELRHRRRMVKNRFYAKMSRAKRQRHCQVLHDTNRMLVAKLQHLKLQLARITRECDLDLHHDCNTDGVTKVGGTSVTTDASPMPVAKFVDDIDCPKLQAEYVSQHHLCEGQPPVRPICTASVSPNTCDTVWPLQPLHELAPSHLQKTVSEVFTDDNTLVDSALEMVSADEGDGAPENCVRDEVVRLDRQQRDSKNYTCTRNTRSKRRRRAREIEVVIDEQVSSKSVDTGNVSSVTGLPRQQRLLPHLEAVSSKAQKATSSITKNNAPDLLSVCEGSRNPNSYRRGKVLQLKQRQSEFNNCGYTQLEADSEKREPERPLGTGPVSPAHLLAPSLPQYTAPAVTTDRDTVNNNILVPLSMSELDKKLQSFSRVEVAHREQKCRTFEDCSIVGSESSRGQEIDSEEVAAVPSSDSDSCAPVENCHQPHDLQLPSPQNSTDTTDDVLGDHSLLSLPMCELNEKLVGYPPEEVKRLKRRRRTLQNRRWWRSSRDRRMRQVQNLAHLSGDLTSKEPELLLPPRAEKSDCSPCDETVHLNLRSHTLKDCDDTKCHRKRGRHCGQLEIDTEGPLPERPTYAGSVSPRRNRPRQLRNGLPPPLPRNATSTSSTAYTLSSASATYTSSSTDDFVEDDTLSLQLKCEIFKEENIFPPEGIESPQNCYNTQNNVDRRLQQHEEDEVDGENGIPMEKLCAPPILSAVRQCRQSAQDCNLSPQVPYDTSTAPCTKEVFSDQAVVSPSVCEGDEIPNSYKCDKIDRPEQNLIKPKESVHAPNTRSRKLRRHQELHIDSEAQKSLQLVDTVSVSSPPCHSQRPQQRHLRRVTSQRQKAASAVSTAKNPLVCQMSASAVYEKLESYACEVRQLNLKQRKLDCAYPQNARNRRKRRSRELEVDSEEQVSLKPVSVGSVPPATDHPNRPHQQQQHEEVSSGLQNGTTDSSRKQGSYPFQEVENLKQRKRKVKNRGYTRNTRSKQLQRHQELEVDSEKSVPEQPLSTSSFSPAVDDNVLAMSEPDKELQSYPCEEMLHLQQERCTVKDRNVVDERTQRSEVNSDKVSMCSPDYNSGARLENHHQPKRQHQELQLPGPQKTTPAPSSNEDIISDDTLVSMPMSELVQKLQDYPPVELARLKKKREALKRRVNRRRSLCEKGLQQHKEVQNRSYSKSSFQNRVQQPKELEVELSQVQETAHLPRDLNGNAVAVKDVWSCSACPAVHQDNMQQQQHEHCKLPPLQLPKLPQTASASTGFPTDDILVSLSTCELDDKLRSNPRVEIVCLEQQWRTSEMSDDTNCCSKWNRRRRRSEVDSEGPVPVQAPDAGSVSPVPQLCTRPRHVCHELAPPLRQHATSAEHSSSVTGLIIEDKSPLSQSKCQLVTKVCSYPPGEGVQNVHPNCNYTQDFPGRRLRHHGDGEADENEVLQQLLRTPPVSSTVHHRHSSTQWHCETAPRLSYSASGAPPTEDVLGVDARVSPTRSELDEKLRGYPPEEAVRLKLKWHVLRNTSRVLESNSDEPSLTGLPRVPPGYPPGPLSSASSVAPSVEDIPDDHDLVSLPICELNNKLRALPAAEAARLRHKRRTLKNRSYARVCRNKRLGLLRTIEAANISLGAKLQRLKADLARITRERDLFRECLARQLLLPTPEAPPPEEGTSAASLPAADPDTGL